MSDQYVEDNLYFSNITQGGVNIFPLGPEIGARDSIPRLLSATYNDNISINSFADVNGDGKPQMSEYKVETPQGTFTLGDFITVDKANGEMHLHAVRTSSGEIVAPDEMWVVQPGAAHNWYPDQLVMKFGEKEIFFDLAQVSNLVIDSGVKLEVNYSATLGAANKEMGVLGMDGKQTIINIAAARTYPEGEELGPNEERKIDFQKILSNSDNFVMQKDYVVPDPTQTVEKIASPADFFDASGKVNDPEQNVQMCTPDNITSPYIPGDYNHDGKVNFWDGLAEVGDDIGNALSSAYNGIKKAINQTPSK